MMAARRGQCACGFVDGLWLEGLSTRLREMQAMVKDRASFVYANNDQMTSEVKDALAGFDQDKTGRVSTSELVAGAKALQEVRPREGWVGVGSGQLCTCRDNAMTREEIYGGRFSVLAAGPSLLCWSRGRDCEVRGQNVFMKKIMMIHSVTMLLLLAGMFGLSIAAMELSKETKVGAEGSLVTPSGAAVLVGSSEMQVVSGPGGSPQLRSRGSSDVDESASALVTVSTPDAVVLDLGVDGEAGGRRLAEAHDIYDLTYCKMETLLKRMPSRDAKFTPYLDVTDAAGNALIEAGEIVGELVGGQDIPALRKRWEKRGKMKMRLHSRKTGEQVQVEATCDKPSKPCDKQPALTSCKVAWTNNKGGKVFDLALFLTGTDPNSDDEVLCLKLDDSAACQRKDFEDSVVVLKSFTALEDADWALNSKGEIEGQPGPITIVRHYRGGKRQEIGLPGMLDVQKDDVLLAYSEFNNEYMSSRLKLTSAIGH